ncbi:fatty acid desaturase [Hoyosella rhizosphaerae]|uniref:Fatty acid desaturase n=1 Tax=Hoyosella rhizosphaerae TaxID=1755582 RepID=A0A916UB10_9ACTN|nr:fatty acid desaturase [Hoyosella rhizosphaerae]MBN4925985.1 fatty acid desaturase [Hoyosella rhizosphaerae]GGC66443.1 putative fatty acid desaturase [Hoyosella rhizosphaerae]
MAITDIKEYAHLTEADVEALGRELDQIRSDIESTLGDKDAKYIRNAIRLQRTLEFSSRAVLFASWFPPAWLLGTVGLGISKIIENMEIGHNVIHGQWDWMNDPEIHSTTWEWDISDPSAHWKQTHNFLHHKYTNVVGLDPDVGYGLLRVTRDRKWTPFNLGNPVYNLLLALLFEYGVAVQHLELAKVFAGHKDRDQFEQERKEVLHKMKKQVAKDYLFFPLLTGPGFLTTLAANVTANVIRNVWAHGIIFCGHFPDGAEKFTKEQYKNETPAEWYLRQMLGSANFKAGPLMRFMSGNLCYQIEHHLYPNMPSNRLKEVSERVQKLADKYDLPYTQESFPKMYLQTWRTITKLALPDRFLTGTSDDAPETNSELKFRIRGGLKDTFIGPDPSTGVRRGLRTAMEASKKRRKIVPTLRKVISGLTPGTSPDSAGTPERFAVAA